MVVGTGDAGTDGREEAVGLGRGLPLADADAEETDSEMLDAVGALTVGFPVAALLDADWETLGAAPLPSSSPVNTFRLLTAQ